VEAYKKESSNQGKGIRSFFLPDPDATYKQGGGAVGTILTAAPEPSIQEILWQTLVWSLT